MTKAEFITEVSEKAGISKKDSEAAVNAFVSAVSGELAKGGK